MADDADKAQVYIEEDLDRKVAAAKRSAMHMQGPALCVQCREPNDRKREGWATCSDCESEMEMSARVRDYVDDGR